MNSASAQHEPPTETVAVTFTPRGDAALDEFADAVVADLLAGRGAAPATTADPAAIAAVLAEVLQAPLTDLADALSAADRAVAGRGEPGCSTATQSFDASHRRPDVPHDRRPDHRDNRPGRGR